jgi:general stress protein YciG
MKEATAAIRVQPAATAMSSAAAGPTTPAVHSRTSRRGFAAMDKARQKEIASAGGRAAHERGHAHEFTTEEARQAGRKGGQTVSQNRQHMAAIGRKGGVARGLRQGQYTHAHNHGVTAAPVITSARASE